MHKRNSLPNPPPLSNWMARQPVALFPDFDGTLVDIAETPDAILVPDDLARRLEGLAARIDGRPALTTGRSLVDIRGHQGPGSTLILGWHRADPGADPIPEPTLPSDATRPTHPPARRAHRDRPADR